MTDPLEYPPPGITQAEWQDMSVSERAAILYRPEPDDFESDWQVERFRWSSR
ncbi:hypothetical protein SUDANB176_04050 [Streptomyces sp. enrichment culture]|uniref:hypothetical protein n=1 Tax=Streptomyces sp. enrichment culture TaxID=1795815 RepID=UPI003F547CF8